MKISTVLVLSLQFILMGCTIPLASPPTNRASPRSTPVVEPVSATPCPTKTLERQVTVTEQPTQITTPPGTGIAPPGQVGTLGPGAGLDTPSPEQIATSQAMTDQSNRNGPDAPTPSPSIPRPASPTSTESTSPKPVETRQLSDQTNPNETVVAKPCQ